MHAGDFLRDIAMDHCPCAVAVVETVFATRKDVNDDRFTGS
jgi:hypothetical protein